MKQNILILVNSFISCSKNQYFKTQLINTEHRTQNTDTEHRTQTHVKNVLLGEHIGALTAVAVLTITYDVLSVGRIDFEELTL